MKIDSNSTPKNLVFAIKTARNISEVLEAIHHQNVNKTVLEEALKEAESYSDKAKQATYLAVIESSHVTPKMLCKIIRENNFINVDQAVLKSPKADTTVLEEALKEVVSYNDKAKEAIYLAVIESSHVTTEMLCKIIKEANLKSVIIETIKSPKANTLVLDEAERIASSFEATYQSEILAAVQEARKSMVPKFKFVETIDVVNQGVNNMNFIIEQEDNVTERIRRNVEDGMSTMLWGLSGIGKTARVREIDPTFTMIKLKNDMLPEEVTGGKEPNGKPGEVYPPKWYVKLCEKCEAEPDRMHILFIDELTNVKNNVKSLVWEIIEDRRVNGDEDWVLPDNCAIVAAGNRPEESTSVITDYNGGVLPEPLHDRFDFHIEIPLDMIEWQKWALETDPKTGNLNIHPAVLSFCISRADEVMFSNLDVDDVTKPRLSPRRWAKLSKAIYMAEKRGGKKCHVSNQRIAECIGSDLAPAFIAHYEKEPLDMKKVEEGLYKPDDFENIDDKLFALGSLIAEYNGSELAVIDFIETCLGDDYVAVYEVMKKQRASTNLMSSPKTQSRLSR